MAFARVARSKEVATNLKEVYYYIKLVDFVFAFLVFLFPLPIYMVAWGYFVQIT